MFHLDENEISSRMFSIEIDSPNLFPNELSQSIEQIRDQYQSSVDQQQNCLHRQFHLEKHFLRVHLFLTNKRKQRSNKLQRRISQTKEKISSLKISNEHLKKQIEDLQLSIQSFQSTGFTFAFLSLIIFSFR